MAKIIHRHHARAVHAEIDLEPRDGNIKTIDTVVFVTATGPRPAPTLPVAPKKAKGIPHKPDGAKGHPLQQGGKKGHPINAKAHDQGSNPGSSSFASFDKDGHTILPASASLGPDWKPLSDQGPTSTSTSVHIPIRTHRPHDTHPEHAPKGTPLRNTRTPSTTAHAPIRTQRPAQHSSPTSKINGSPLRNQDSTPTSITGHPLKQDDGMSSGAKAGLAIGIILILGLVAGLAFLFYRRKKSKNDSHQKLDDEKSTSHNPQASLTSHVSVRRPNKEAPRLSLRPMTELMFASPEERANHALFNNQNTVSRSAPAEESGNEKAMNPFDDNSQIASSAAAPKPLNVISEGSSTSPDLSESSSGRNSPNPAGAPRSSPAPGPNNVHRVQLDFAPSMEDELELKAGQVVRMLHEYDDGWALCIRLDRSQQGVVPRTCISKLPIKPRPRGPPGSGARGPSRTASPNNQAKRQSPTESMSSSSSGSSQESRARAQSSAPPPQSPSADARPRSSTSGGYPESRRITPPSPLNPASSPTNGNVPSRKPVPGQAL